MNTMHLPREADTIVIGAGSGGAALAGTLAAHSTDAVLVLEAGPDYGSLADGRWPDDVLSAKAIPLSHDWGLTTSSGLDLPRARVVGGCSAHNGCTALLGAREDYDDWAAANPGWEAATVEPLLGRVHESFRVRRYRMDELTSAQQAFVGAGVRAGLPFADDLDDLAASVGIGPMPVNIVGTTRWNAAFAFLDPVRPGGHLTVAGNSTVRRIVFERGRAAGVEVSQASGAIQFVRAGRVVVAGGAYHSPALLQRSGVGPAGELRALGISPVADLPGVGRHLLDHACVQLDFHGKEGLLTELARIPWHPDEQSVGRARSSRCDTGPYDIHVFMVAGANSGHPGLPPVSLYGGAMRARSEGRVVSTPFERDIDDQAEALRAFAQSALSPAVTRLLGRRYDRIVLTGMGSSHFAALPGWRRLADAGHPAWWVDSGQLLDAPGLITPGTLLVATSQSGGQRRSRGHGGAPGPYPARGRSHRRHQRSGQPARAARPWRHRPAQR